MKAILIGALMIFNFNVVASELETVTISNICSYLVTHYYPNSENPRAAQKGLKLCYQGEFDYPHGQDSTESVFSVYYKGKAGTPFDMECSFSFWGYSMTKANCE